MKQDGFLSGGYDLHIHAAPSPFHRALDDYELLKAADRAQMAGILLKSHYESTAARAELVNAHSDTEAKAYGAIALNWPVGGLNPYAVHNALKRGAKIVYMPTRDAENSLRFGNMPGDFFARPGIKIFDGLGRLKKEVYEIMEVVREFHAILATGHLAPEESVRLCTEGVRAGVRMALTHPEFPRTKIPSRTQRELAERGVYIEKCWYNIAEQECTVQEMAAHIREVGAAHCFMTTDRGQSRRETPVEGMRRFASVLLENGIGENNVHQMLCEVPAQMIKG